MTVNNLDVLSVAAQFSYLFAGDQQINTYHYELNTGGPMSDALAVVDMGLILEKIYTHVLSSQATTYKYVDFTVTNITQALLLGTFPWPTLTQGVGTGVLASSQVCALIFGRTAVPRVQIRKYFGGMQEEDIQDSTMIAAALTRYQNAGIEIIAQQGVASGTWDPIAYNTALDRRTKAVSSAVSLSTRTQRRRTRGRGA